MNKLKHLFLLVAPLLITACGGDDNKNDEPIEGNTYRQSVTIDADNVVQTVILTDLKSAITNVENGAEWLVVTKNAYSSGAPSVELRAEANETGSDRQTIVTVDASSGDKVLLTVKQSFKASSFRYSITMEATDASVVRTLSDMHAAIASINVSDTWLTAEKLSYSGGSPSVMLKATDNPNAYERTTIVLLTSTDGIEVTWEVTQKAGSSSGSGTTINDLHNSESDRTAYSRRQK